jgi:hypothetical protein
MNSIDDQDFMNDQRFFNLAMKVNSHRCSDAERAELETLLASRPELKARLEELQADAQRAREVLPLLEAAESSTPEFPSYARERLLSKVRQTIKQTRVNKAKPIWRWQWTLGLAAGAAIVVLLLVLPTMMRPSSNPVIQIALLDTAGAVRGPESGDVEVLRQQWKNSSIQNFDKTDLLKAWETKWPDGERPAVKIIYDRISGDLDVLLLVRGRLQQKTFSVKSDLTSTLKDVNAFIQDQTKR